MGQQAQTEKYGYPIYGEPGGCTVSNQAIRVELSQNKTPGQLTSNSKYTCDLQTFSKNSEQ